MAEQKIDRCSGANLTCTGVEQTGFQDGCKIFAVAYSCSYRFCAHHNQVITNIRVSNSVNPEEDARWQAMNSVLSGCDLFQNEII